MNIADVAPERIRPLLRAEYDRLVESGAFESERVELLEGMLVTMTPQDAGHAHSVQRLAEALTLALRGKAIIRTQSLLALLDDSEPEPDIAVVPLGDYSSGHPRTRTWSLRFPDPHSAEIDLSKDRFTRARALRSSGWST